MLASLAAADVPYGYAEAGHRNVLVSVQISLGDPWGSRFQIDLGNTKVSFTMVDAHFAAKAETEPYGGSEPYGDADVIKIRAKVGSSKTHSWNYAPGGDPPGGGTVFDDEAGHARFASTNFADGANVVLMMEATVRLYEGGSHTDVVLPVSASVKAHNKQLTFGTTVGLQPNPFLPSMEEVSTDFSQRARTKLDEAKHDSLSAADLQTRPGLDGLLGQLTAMCVATHGAPGGFCDSYTDDYDDPVHGYDWSEAGFHVGLSGRNASGEPLPNLVLMYSCDCFGAAAAATFGIDAESVDKAFLGFDQKVLPFLAPGNSEPVILFTDIVMINEETGEVTIAGYLHQHMEKLLDDARGSGRLHANNLIRISEAIESANSLWMPRSINPQGDCAAAPTQPFGDFSSTRQRVYMNNFDWLTVPPGAIVTWCFFYP